MTDRGATRRSLFDDHVGPREPLGFAERVVGHQRGRAIGHRDDLAVLVEVQVDPGHVEPDLGLVLDALQRVHRARRLIEIGAGAGPLLMNN